MKVRFAGSHIQHGIIKAGVAFYAEAGKDESFVDHFVWKPIIPPSGIPDGLEGEALQTWLDALPKKQELNPTFTYFIRVDPTTTLSDLKAEIQRIFTSDVLASADTFLHRRDLYEAESKATGDKSRWKAGCKEFSKFRKMMAARERLGNGLVLPKGYNAEGLITAANNKFKPLGGELDSKGDILNIPPATIDIGAAAIGRTSASYANWTEILKDNPANADGAITSVEIWCATNLVNCEVATFFVVSGDNLSTRDSEALGAVTSGSKQTFSGLDMDVETGDYLGCHFTGGAIEADDTGAGCWEIYGDQIPCTNVEFDVWADYVLSLYGEGEEAAPTPKNVSDTGSGADSVPSISVALSLAETGEGVETIPGMSPTIPVIPDTGAGADIIAALEAALSLAETGSGVDAVDVSFYITFVNVADIGEGADVINLDITIPAIEDSGVGVEAILGEYTKFIADQMFSSEYIVPVTASMILSELAAGEDSIAILITPVIAETGEALDSIVVAASLTIAEAGSGVDTPSITVTLTIPEVGAGVDSALAAVSITIADTGEGVEAILRRVLQLARLFIMTRSKTSMAVKTGHKARIKLTFQHRKW